MTPDQKKWLDWLHKLGGNGYIDRYGRVVAGGEVSPQGAAVAWLKLVAAGFIKGEGDRIMLTPAALDALVAKETT